MVCSLCLGCFNLCIFYRVCSRGTLQPGTIKAGARVSTPTSHTYAVRRLLLRGLQFWHTAVARTLTWAMMGLSLSSGHATALRRLWIRAAAKARLMFAS